MTTDYLDNQVAERTSDYPTKMPAKLVGVIIRRPNNKRPQYKPRSRPRRMRRHDSIRYHSPAWPVPDLRK